MYIKSAISNELKRAPRRFCTPGHKGRLCKSDITESDSFPLDAIKNAERSVAGMLNVPWLRFLTGGSSIGIKAALMGAGDILAAKNSHQSIAEAAALGGHRLFLIDNEARDGLKLPLTARQIEDGLKKYPSAKTVVIASPDYYGLTAAVDAGQAVKDAGRLLYADAAHGAHFLFRPDLFDCSLFGLADAFNLSAHKTLPAYTQTAYLAVNNADLIPSVERNLMLLGTTSPSYPMLAGLEYAAEYTHGNKPKYDALKKACKQNFGHIACVKNNDFTRIVIDAKALGFSGSELYSALEKRGVRAEKYDARYVIFIVTICDTPRTVARLANCIEREIN